jgi:hypothetical protein
MQSRIIHVKCPISQGRGSENFILKVLKLDSVQQTACTCSKNKYIYSTIMTLVIVIAAAFNNVKTAKYMGYSESIKKSIFDVFEEIELTKACPLSEVFIC